MSGLDDDEEDLTPGRPGVPVAPSRIVRALWRGKLWVIVAGVIGAAIGIAAAKFLITRSWVSSATLRYEGLPGHQLPHEVGRAIPGLVAVTGTEELLYPVRNRMNIDGANLDAMRAIVSATADDGAGLITFTAYGDSAERAAETANVAVEVFLDHHRQRRQRELEADMASVDERMSAARAELEQARARYDEFREANHITDIDAEQEAAIEQMAELRSRADLSAAEVEAQQARIAQLERTLARTSRTETVSTGASESAMRLGALRQQLQEAQGQGLSEDHPTVQSLRRQVQALQASGAEGMTTSRTTTSSVYTRLSGELASARTELEATRERHESLTNLVEQARERSTTLSSIEGDAANHLAAVNVNQALITRLSEEKAGIEDQLRDVQTGLIVVQEARPPENPVPSKKRIIVAGAIPILFVGLVFLILLFREFKGLRLKTADEVAWWASSPVVATSTWPRAGTLFDLVADMDDFVDAAAGTMLIVGLRDEERELAKKLAYQLADDVPPPDIPAAQYAGDKGEVFDARATIVDDADIVAEVMRQTAAARNSLPSGDGDGAEDAPRMTLPDGTPAETLNEGEGLPPLAGAPTLMEIQTNFDDARPAGGAEAPMPGGATDPDARAPESRAIVPFNPASVPPPGWAEAGFRPRLVTTAWNGQTKGQALRRAARRSDRVLVLVTSGEARGTDLAGMKTLLGRDDGIGYVLVGASDAVAKLSDRCGPVEAFWEVSTSPDPVGSTSPPPSSAPPSY